MRKTPALITVNEKNKHHAIEVSFYIANHCHHVLSRLCVCWNIYPCGFLDHIHSSIHLVAIMTFTVESCSIWMDILYPYIWINISVSKRKLNKVSSSILSLKITYCSCFSLVQQLTRVYVESKISLTNQHERLIR